MNQLDKQYQELLFDIIERGVDKDTRNGKTRSVFGKQIRHKMKDGFPLLTTKKMYWKGIVTELLWFLRGDTNIKFLVDNGCHIWDGDAYKRFQKTCQFEKDANHILPDEWISMSNDFMSADILTQEEFINKIKTDTEFAERWGDLGPVYGRQWRSWKFTDKFTNGEQIAYVNGKVDQIANLINDLKTNPDSRRLMVSAWNVGELDQMTLPPCHYGFQVYTRELSWKERVGIFNKKKECGEVVVPEFKSVGDMNAWTNKLLDEVIPERAISLMWNQRSVDVPLGLPFNVASYGLLLEILAKMTNMVPDELIGNLGDCHIYENQLPGCREQITREPYALPKLYINTEFWATSDDVVEYTLDTEILSMLIEDFQIEGYESHPSIKFPLSN
jgi:thymidylate synthase